ncbi:MAG: glycosyltransferase family 4 protein, partial [Pseudomonadota bacterium]
DGPVREAYKANGIDCIVDDGFAASPSVFSNYERDVAAIAARLRDLAPDLVFANTLDCFPIIDAAHLADVPSVWNIRESEPWRERLADRNVNIAARALACFDYAHSVVFVAAASQENWSPFCRRGQASVIYNAPAPFEPLQDKNKLRARFGWGDDDTVLLSLGAVCPRKGQEDLVAALHLLPPQSRDAIKAVFVGAPEAAYVKTLENLMTAEVCKRCEFIGSVDNPLDYLAAADLLVNTSRSEAFPRVFLEAAGLRTPMIATPVNGAFERMEHMSSVWFYSVGDHASLAEAIESLRNSAERRKSLADGAYAALVEKWSFNDMVAAYDRTLKAALVNADA